MIRRQRMLEGVLLLGLLHLACATVPIMDPTTALLPEDPKRTDVTVANAIKAAALQTGWELENDGPGQMQATLRRRSHVAVVTIIYDASGYRIEYKDSTNLDHEGDRIHRGYNKWVRKLDARIRKQLGYD
jgi:hypothetical protein